MTGDNIQHWDDVNELPWREAFEMSSLPDDLTLGCLPDDMPVRRRTDIRTLADVVAEMGRAA